MNTMEKQSFVHQKKGDMMGRFYNGDIEGKFWFAIQDSEAPNRFGGSMELSFSFNEDDIEDVKNELKTIEETTPMDKINEFFKDRDSYSNEMLAEANITRDELENYADHELGSKILACLEENGECNFWGEM